MLERNYIGGQTSVKIAASVERALSTGRAAAGDPLPPVRATARSLGVSPATVAAAYRLLRDRGVVIADGRRGTRIREATPIVTPSAPLPAGVRDLATGNPDPKLLPKLGTLRPRQRLYGGALNDPELLAQARAQFDADGVPPGDVAVMSGALDGIERVLREHLRPGDRVLVEDPCFTGIADILASLALTPVPVAVDDEGLRFDALRRALMRPAAALIVTPRAQNPTGAAISARRARQLRSLLRPHPDLLLIEDDHAGVVAGAPYNTLLTPSHRRWIVVCSVSKSLGPDLRVSLLAADPLTIARVEGRQTLGIRWVSHVLQRLVVTLWKHATTTRLLHHAADTYAARRAALIDALACHGIEAHGASGLNVWIPVADESSIVRGLFDRGWAVNAGERYRLEAPPAIRVTIASLEPKDAARFARDLAGLLVPRGRASVA
ncbi:MAG TPA: aminotransferase class I/II-fold pyridoxal phosphate-dependent enzyme [Thermoanaerobaculia bacterium]|nr:aminotransferase class I/II-fold pyridoxal phosphate-dependent enzyme [Thermoanaerobaculia bacterium]